MLLHQLHRIRGHAVHRAVGYGVLIAARLPPRRVDINERYRADHHKSPAQRAFVELRVFAGEKTGHQQRGENHTHAIAAKGDEHKRRVELDAERADQLQRQQRTADVDQHWALRLPTAKHHVGDTTRQRQRRDKAARIRD